MMVDLTMNTMNGVFVNITDDAGLRNTTRLENYEYVSIEETDSVDVMQLHLCSDNLEARRCLIPEQKLFESRLNI